jgi:hypothetical protein
VTIYELLTSYPASYEGKPAETLDTKGLRDSAEALFAGQSTGSLSTAGGAVPKTTL